MVMGILMVLATLFFVILPILWLVGVRPADPNDPNARPLADRLPGVIVNILIVAGIGAFVIAGFQSMRMDNRNFFNNNDRHRGTAFHYYY
jgi:hypothetical protein